MIAQYFKFALKVLIKNRLYTIINVLGLFCGMLTALVIGKYLGASLNFDRFHDKSDEIYFISQQETVEGSTQEHRNATYYGVGELLNEFPEVIEFSRYYQHVEALMMAGDEKSDRATFTENKIFVVDSSFLNIFTFPLIHGDKRTVLSRVNSIVLTKSAAQRYFGNTDPLGGPLTIRSPWGKETTYVVTGVLDNIPALSRFQFDFLITEARVGHDEFWNFPDCSTYVLLKDRAKARELGEKLSSAVIQIPQLKSSNRKMILSLQSFADIRLSNTEYLLAAVGIFVTLLCWLNYINQMVGQSFWRIKQISILRILGASSASLRAQFIVESLFVCITSLALVFGTYAMFEKPLQSLTHGHLLPLMHDPTFFNLLFVTIFVAGAALAASVPNLIFATKTFGATLSNIYAARIGGVGLRKMLVVIQFSISTVFIVSLVVTKKQLHYITNKDKGLTMKDVLVVKTPMVKDTSWHVKRETLEVFKTRCRELPFVIDIASSTTVPGEEYRQETYVSLVDNSSKTLVHQAGVDEHFFSLFEIKFVAGHDFIPDARHQNRRSIILNESAASALGIIDYNKAISKQIIDHEDPSITYDLIGIVKDHHQTSLRYEMRPMAFRFNEFRGHFSVKINDVGSDQERKGMQLMALKKVWEQTYADASFDTFLLNEKYEAQNMEDQYFEKLFASAAILSIVISCVGLFGLSILISSKRQKEVAIRKTFGASSSSILASFLKGYLGTVSLSVLIGSFVAYFLMNEWLSSYAYRIKVGSGLIAISVLAVILVFLCTICFHTIKSSLTNPADILKE